MPEKPFSWVPKEDLLSFEDLFSFIKICIDNGVNKIRITGGEPLLREGLDSFIKLIYDYKNDIDLAMTTNAYLLKKTAKTLKDAGLKRVNISLDTLNTATAKQISQKDILKNVLEGIEEAIKVNLEVKLNTVILKNINDNEIHDLIEYAKDRNIPIRFIEYMENKFAKDNIEGLSADEIKKIISEKYPFTDIGKEENSPSNYYKLQDGYVFGTIEPYGSDFCKTCNRIRLSAQGLIIPCLYFDEGASIKDAIRNKDIKKAGEILQHVLDNKPEKNKWSKDNNDKSDRAFYVTGG
jgi:cyclic pyranopterin phosphate synthase